MSKRYNNKNDIAQATLFGFEDEDNSAASGEFIFKKPQRRIEELSDENKTPTIQTPIIDEVKGIDTNISAFRFMSFGSGSSGNCAYVGGDKGGILIDAGVEITHVFDSLLRNGISPDDVKGICLTHDHGDHIRYAYTIVRKYRHIHIYCTNRVMNGILRRHNVSRRIKDRHVAIYKEIPIEISGLKITAFEVPHDGSDNAGFFIEYGSKNFAIATDLGHVSQRAYHYMTQAHYLMIESNYDGVMLDEGRYPEYLKSRIRAANGHLNNKDTARFIADNYREDLKYIFLCHLSNDNNTPEIARKEIVDALSEKNVSVGEGTGTLSDREKQVQLVALPRYDSSLWYILRD